MLTKNKLNLIGKFLLFTATVIWGSSFIILKNSLDNFPMYLLLCFRFLIGGILFGLVFIKKVVLSNKKTLIQGVFLGCILAVAYTVQTYGLVISNSASKNAFLTASYCVLVPFLAWGIFRKKPNLYNVLSGIICIVGIGFVSLSQNLSINIGDLLSFSCGIFYGLQIIFADKFLKDAEPISMLTFQLLTAGIIFGIISLFVEVNAYNDIFITINTLFPVIYLTIAATCLAQLLQIYGQKHTSPSEASLILSLESVFGVIFATLVDGEKLTLKLIIGFVLIFVAIIINETKLDFLKRGKSKND